MRLTSLFAAALALPLAAAPLAAQGAPAPAGPEVGAKAPDFRAVPVDRNGATKPFELSKAGETVVLAFFPRARTSGCTAQLTTYRDQYAQLFRDGKGVTLLAISTDVDSTLIAWAQEAKFPFRLVSDADGAIGRAYGAYIEASRMDNRLLYVIGADGRITYTAKPFRPLSPDAYTELGKAIAGSAR